MCRLLVFVLSIPSRMFSEHFVFASTVDIPVIWQMSASVCASCCSRIAHVMVPSCHASRTLLCPLRLADLCVALSSLLLSPCARLLGPSRSCVLLPCQRIVLHLVLCVSPHFDCFARYDRTSVGIARFAPFLPSADRGLASMRSPLACMRMFRKSAFFSHP